MKDDQLRNFLIQKLNENHWSYREFGLKIGMSHTKIAQFVSGQQAAGDEFCRRISDFFNIPIEDVWSLAGIRPAPRVPRGDPSISELAEIGRKLSHRRRRDLLEIARILLVQESRGLDSNSGNENSASGE